MESRGAKIQEGKGLAIYVDPEYRAHAKLVEGIRDLGFDVLAVESGEDALKEAKVRAVSIAIIDTDLRDMNGIKLGAMLKERSLCPTVFLTNGYTSTFAAAAKAVGGTSVLSKRSDNDELLTQIDMCHAHGSKLTQSETVNKRLKEKLENVGMKESMLGAYMTIWEEDHQTVKARLDRFARSRRMSLEDLAEFHREHTEAQVRIKDEFKERLVNACPPVIKELNAFYAKDKT